MSTKYIVHTGDRSLEAVVVEHEGFYEISIDGAVHRIDSRGRAGGPSRSLIVDGRSYEVATVPGREGLDVYVSGDAFQVRVTDELWARTGADTETETGEETVRSPMPGSVVRILVNEGDRVEPGQPVVIVEAMKMQNELAAVRRGTVISVRAKEGDVVDQDAPLVLLQPADGEA